MNGAKVIKKGMKKDGGSATIEAAIALPVFLFVLFSLAYIIRIFYTYNTIQASLSEVARRIGNMSYFYHVSGLKDYSDQLNHMAQEAGGTLEEQKNTIVDAFSSFNNMLYSAQRPGNPGDYSIDQIQQLLEDVKSFDADMTEAWGMVQSIISDPKEELRLFMTIFAQKLSYEVTNRLVCLIAKGDLGAELNKRVKSGGRDAALSLGVIGGIGGMDFNQNSSIFGDTESLELVVRYSIKAPFGFIPELKLTNRTKIIAWTGGRGVSVKVNEENQTSTTASSIWTEMDQDSRYWDRGLEIENTHVEKLINEGKSKGLESYATSKDYPVIDAYTINKNTGEVVYYDVFTLNPHLKTYSTRPNEIRYAIKKHGKSLLECKPPDLYGVEVKNVRRIVVLVIPDNSGDYAVKAYTEACKELLKLNVEVLLVKGYGSYQAPDEIQEPAESQNITQSQILAKVA